METCPLCKVAVLGGDLQSHYLTSCSGEPPPPHSFIVVKEKPEGYPRGALVKQPTHSNDLQYHSHGGRGRLIPYGGSVALNSDEVAPLTEEFCTLLDAILSPADRYKVYSTPGELAWGVGLKVGDTVLAKLPDRRPSFAGGQNSQYARAIIRWKGQVDIINGKKHKFGVEITDQQHHGCGNTDGTYIGPSGTKRYFTCKEKCGLMLNLAELKVSPDSRIASPAAKQGPHLQLFKNQPRQVHVEKEVSTAEEKEKTVQLQQKLWEKEDKVTSLLEEVRKRDDRIEDLQREVENTATKLQEERLEKDNTIAILQEEMRVKEDIVSMLQEQVRERESTVTRLQGEARERENTVTRLQGEVRERESIVTRLQGEARERENTVTTLQGEVRERESTVTRLQGEVRERENTVTTLQAEVREKETLLTRLREEMTGREDRLQEEVRQGENRVAVLEGEVRELVNDREHHENEMRQARHEHQQLVARVDTAIGHLRGEAVSPQALELWELPRQEVHISQTILGTGGWGYVARGTFQGQAVAVKCLHRGILSPQNEGRLRREISIMSQVRHPNLLLLIGAVLTAEGAGPLIVTEILDRSLRSAYEEGVLEERSKVPVLRDVSSALTYLHSHRTPIIHRDVSSANVLLEAIRHMQWKAKLSDFGSANLSHLANTPAEGAAVYAAPEIDREDRSRQTAKIDVYSFGVLVCEVCLCRFPPERRHFPSMLSEVRGTAPDMFALSHDCTSHAHQERPMMREVLQRLDQFMH